MYINLPEIKKNLIEKRDYQVNIALSCLNRSTLIVLPTGLGKTIIALLVITSSLKKGGKILFLAPTKPLVEQHTNFLKNSLNNDKIIIFTGEVSPKKRNELWEENTIIISTPQVIENDIISKRISLNDVSLIIFDEAHRAVGNYSYVFIAEKYKEKKNKLSLGMTASPGSNAEKILEVCQNLGIGGVEIRSEYDRDVKEYVQYIKIQWIKVDVPEYLKEILGFLNEVYVEKLKKLKNFGFLQRTTMVSKKKLLVVQQDIQKRMKLSFKPPKSLFQAATLQSQAIKITHAIELCETQGVFALKDYFERLKNEAYSKGGSKAAKILINDERIQKAIELTLNAKIEHPKLEKIIDIVKQQIFIKEDSRIIIFTNYRDTSMLVSEELRKINGIKPARFVGQAKRGEDKGLSQKKQIEIIQKFRDGEYNVMVATSVAEEGLDIPATDLVIFYEPIASEIRTIQRRGRTGRKKPGRVVVLITKKTRDEAYYWSSRSKEKSMKRELEYLREELSKKLNENEIEKEGFENILEKIPGIKKEVGFENQDKEFEVLKEEKIIVGEIEIPKEKIKVLQEENKEIKKIECHGPKKIEKIKIEKKKGQLQIFDFEAIEEQFKIIVDTREFKSNVVRELSRKNILINSQQLEIGDYVLSDRIGVERKEVKDFLQSLIDGRLFSQLKMLKNKYQKPLLILEGEGLFIKRNINPSAIFGSLASIITDFNIPIISTKDGNETAELLATIARREFGQKRIASIRGEKGHMSMRERQQFIIEGLPNISAVLAQRLLVHFGNIKAIIDADVKDLCEVKGIGKKIAQGIVDVAQAGYLKKRIN